MKSDINQALEFYWLEIPIKSRNDIKKRYKKLTMIHHPDRWWKEENFKLLSKYKNILEKNFSELNETYFKIQEEKEKLKTEYKNNNKIIELIWYEVKKIKLWILEKFNLFLEFIVIYCLSLLVRIIFYLLWIILLFTLPLSFYTEEHNIIFNEKYTESWYITNNIEIWEFNDVYIRELWEYDEEYKNHNKTIYPIEKLEERKKILIEIFLKAVSLYLFILLIYSIIYHFLIKRYIKIWIDKYLKNKYLKNFKYTTIYYFIMLYLLFYIITKFILLIY